MYKNKKNKKNNGTKLIHRIYKNCLSEKVNSARKLKFHTED